LSVNTDQKVISPSSGTLVDDSHNAGDDTIIIDQIGVSTLAGAVDQINGGNGRDTVRGEIPGSPTDSTLSSIAPGRADLTQLRLSNGVNLIVENSQNPNGVQWTAGDGELSAGHGVKLLSLDGAGSVQVLGGTGPNTLSAVSSGPTHATIDGNKVTL